MNFIILFIMKKGLIRMFVEIFIRVRVMMKWVVGFWKYFRGFLKRVNSSKVLLMMVIGERNNK